MCKFSNSLVSTLSVSLGSYSGKFRLFPVGSDGSPLKGFSMTICDDITSVLSVLAGWSRFSDVFGIFYVLLSVDGGETIKLYRLHERETL